MAADVGVLEDVGGAEVGDVSGSLLLSGSTTHSLEKDMSSSATSPLKPSPCSYLKTIWEGRKETSLTSLLTFTVEISVTKQSLIIIKCQRKSLICSVLYKVS